MEEFDPSLAEFSALHIKQPLEDGVSILLHTAALTFQ